MNRPADAARRPIHAGAPLPAADRLPPGGRLPGDVRLPIPRATRPSRGALPAIVARLPGRR
ncbi:MAG: hypothetical protein PHN82_12115 [bacterium]|nr:hypothetical protein [bacterium]